MHQSIPVLCVPLQCESVQPALEGLGAQRGVLQPQLEALEKDVKQLKEWSAGLAETRTQLQTSVGALTKAVGQIEERTSAITKDFTNKVRLIDMLLLILSHFVPQVLTVYTV